MIPELDNEKLRKALTYLADQEMDVELLRDLHHNSARSETFKDAIRYRSPGYETYNDHNIVYHRRLLFVAAEHWRTGLSFGDLVVQARERFPDA